jgi:hypothetical protein
MGSNTFKKINELFLKNYLTKKKKCVIIYSILKLKKDDIMNFKGLIYNGIDYSDKFKISDCGKIKRTNGDILKTVKNKNGYEHICVSIGSRKDKKVFKIHRAVACTFISNPENKKEVNHIDFNKLNNCVSNLEWTTKNENTLHSVKNNIFKPLCKKVINLDNGIIFDSITLAGEWLYKNKNLMTNKTTPSKSISRCCNKHKHTSYGYRWEFL